jgi:peptidoglycan hydrolase CwlO-like protein
MPDTNGKDWLRTGLGSISSIVVISAFGYSLVIAPMQLQVGRLQDFRETDRTKISDAYTLIQTNDQYKKLVQEWVDGLRRDLTRVEGDLKEVSAEQKRRTSGVASIGSLEKEIDNLRHELEGLRQRIMVPITQQQMKQ